MSGRALSKAQSAVVDAERDRDRWVVALAEAESAAAGALDVDVADPAQLDAAGEHAARTASKVAAARRALVRAEARVDQMRRDVLLVEAADEAALAAGITREFSALQGKVEALLSQLEALNNVRYEMPDDDQVRRRVDMGERVEIGAPRTWSLQVQARVHRVRAAVLRTTARSGRVPQFFSELDEEFPGVGVALLVPEVVPPSARAFEATLFPDPVEPDSVELDWADVAAE